MRRARQSVPWWWQWALCGAIVGCAALTGWLQRQAMLSNRLPIEGQYAVNVQYGSYFLATEGRLFDVTGEIPTISNYTSGVSYGAIDFAHTLVHGAALSVAQLSNPIEIGTAYFLFPWQSLVLVPLGVLAVYWRVCRLRRRDPQPLAVAVLYSFASTGHYAMVNWGLTGGLNLPYGWAVLIAIYLVLIHRSTAPGGRVATSALIAGLLLLTQPTYHTIAIALVVILATIALGQRILGFRFVQPATIGIAAVGFLAFLAYNATPFLRAYAELGFTFLADLLRSHDVAASQHLSRVGGFDLVIQSVNYVAIGVMAVLAGALWLRTRGKQDPSLSLHVLWLAGLIPLAIGFFAWNGMIGVQARILQLGTLLAVLGGTFVLVEGRRWAIAASTALVVATICTVYSVSALRLGDINLLTSDEWRALEWYSDEPGCDAVLLTDFRIGPAATYNECFKVIGPSAAALARSERSSIVTDLYYSDESIVIAEAIENFETTDGDHADLVLVSKAMIAGAGPLLPDGRLTPMSRETWIAYGALPGWTVVYESKSVMILGRSDSDLDPALDPTGKPEGAEPISSVGRNAAMPHEWGGSLRSPDLRL